MNKLIAKMVCAIRGHQWSRWCKAKDGARSRFCKRECGVARETRVALAPKFVQPQGEVTKHD